jgi:hypothetical protein
MTTERHVRLRAPVEVVVEQPAADVCEECGGGATVRLQASPKGYAVRTDHDHGPVCSHTVCPHGNRWGIDDCEQCDADELRRSVAT